MDYSARWCEKVAVAISAIRSFTSRTICYVKSHFCSFPVISEALKITHYPNIKTCFFLSSSRARIKFAYSYIIEVHTELITFENEILITRSFDIAFYYLRLMILSLYNKSSNTC